MTIDEAPVHSYGDPQKTVYMLDANPSVRVPSLEERHPMIQLNGGKEQPAYASTRFVMFQRFWSSKKRMIQEVIKEKNNTMFHDIANHLAGSCDREDHLRSALLMMGTNISNHPFILGNITRYLRDFDNFKIVSLSSKDCTTMKNTLTSLLRQVVDNAESDDEMNAEGGEEEEERDFLGHSLSYDFDLIANWLNEKDQSYQIVVILQDAELFDPHLLDKLLTLIQQSSVCGNFKVVFGLSSSVSLFEENLTSHSIDVIEGQTFDLADSTKLFEDLTDKVLFDLEVENNDDFLLILGPNLLSQLANCEKNEMLFFDMLKYAYSIYFYNNPLSILNLVTVEQNDDFEIDGVLIDLLRRTPSFKNRIEELKVQKKRTEITELFEIPEALAQEFKFHYKNFYHYGVSFYKLLDLFVTLQKSFNDGTVIQTKYQLYSAIIRKSNEFYNSRFYEELKKLISENTEVERLDTFLHNIDSSTFITHDHINATLGEYLIEDMDANILRATCIRLSDFLDDYIKQFLKDFSEIAYKEIFTVEVQPDASESILTSSFNPFIRSSIETALISPNSYLMRSSYASDAYDKISRLIEPVLSELFALYREATIYINIHDFFIAFKESIQREKLVAQLLEILPQEQQITRDPDLEVLVGDLKEVKDADLSPAQELIWQKITLSWFYQAMSELELLGFVKEAKKKSDSVEKLVWKGI